MRVSVWPLALVSISLLFLACGGAEESPLEAGLPESGVTDDAAPDGDVPPQCVSDEDCDDGLFCTGIEACVEGVCAAGETPVIDDGIDCTVDACDEAMGAITNTVDDTLCPNGDAICNADGVTLTGQIGRCDVEMMGCILEDGATEDCSAVEATRSCEANEIRETIGFCQAGEGENPAECATRLDLIEDCTIAMLPGAMCMGTADVGDLSHSTYSAATCVVSEGTPSCVPTEMPMACTAPGDSCASGRLTTHEASCTDSAGCATSRRIAGCPDRRDSCTDGSLTSYGPSCADGSTCGAPSAMTSMCPDRTDSCASGRITRYTPRCASTALCNRTPASATSNCPDRADVCSSGRLTRYTPRCASTRTCNATPSSSTSGCSDPADSCSSGRLTRYTPTCNSSGTACGTASSDVSDCADRADSCSGGRLTTYTPRCSTTRTCNSTPRSNTSTCSTPANRCAGRTLTTYSPTCRGSACGTASAATTTCSNSYSRSSDARSCTLTTRSCNASAGRCDATIETWRCDDIPARCDTSGSTTVWRRGSSASCPRSEPSSSGWCTYSDGIGGSSSVTCSGNYREYCSTAFQLTRISYTGACSADGGCTTETETVRCFLGCVGGSAGGSGGVGSTAYCRGT